MVTGRYDMRALPAHHRHNPNPEPVARAIHMEIDPNEVRRLRESRAWSQEHLAGVAGLSVRTVQRVERGDGASLETRMALASALGVEPAVLCAPSPNALEASAPPVPEPVAPGALSEQQFRWLMVILGAAIVVGVFLALGYMFGRDLAHKSNREAAACVAEGRTDCKADRASP